VKTSLFLCLCLCLCRARYWWKLHKTNKWVRSSYVSAYAYVYVVAVFTCTCAYSCACACAYALVKTSLYVTYALRGSARRVGLVTTWHETTGWPFPPRKILNFTAFKHWNCSFNFPPQLIYKQRTDMNDTQRKSDVESSRQDQTQLASASESRNCTLLSIFISVSLVLGIIRVNISGI